MYPSPAISWSQDGLIPSFVVVVVVVVVTDTAFFFFAATDAVVAIDVAGAPHHSKSTPFSSPLPLLANEAVNHPHSEIVVAFGATTTGLQSGGYKVQDVI